VPRIYCLISFHPNQFQQSQITRENLINKIYNSYIAFRVARYSNDMTLREFLEIDLIETEKFNVTVSDVILILMILIVTIFLMRAIKRVFRIRETKKQFDPGRSHAILQIIRYILWITAILLSLQVLKIKLTLLLAGSAALLVGLGLGLQQIFQDVMSGIAILFEGSLKVGDIVEIQNEIVGRVIEIGIRTSKIETRDNIIMVVPNSKFVSDIVINWSHMEKKTRFHIDVGVSYGSDVKLVTSVLLKCAEDHGKVSTSPKPFVRFKDFGNSSLDFQLYFWSTETFQVENIKSEIRYEIDAAFRQNQITIPFPQRDVHIKSQK
jgi:small-conductance mechanosensitive channel